MKNTPILGVFVRCPVKGKVKTRISSTLTEDFTLSLYEAFIKDVYIQVERVTKTCDIRKALFFDSPTKKNKLEQIIEEKQDFPWAAQAEGNLGERIAHFFRWSFENGANEAVLIGSDAPTVPDQYIANAFSLLSKSRRSSTVVIGPSMDGGYYLIGMKKPGTFDIFSNIPWGTANVLKKTLALLDKNIELLPPWYDVDDESSFNFMKTHIYGILKSGASVFPKNTARLTKLSV